MDKKTGYPHIDKPWMKYYDEELINSRVFPHKTLVDFMKDNLKEEKADIVAHDYYGFQRKYHEFYDDIDEAAKVLQSLDIKNNDRVMYLMPGIPETANLFYGGSVIGAVSDYVDPRPSSSDLTASSLNMLKLIQNEKPKRIICLEQCYLALIKPIENVLKDMGLDDIVLVSAKDSMTKKGSLKFLSEALYINGYTLKGIKQTVSRLKEAKAFDEKLKEAKATSNLILHNYKDLLKNVNYEIIKKAPYEKGKIEVITHSSGTTSGTPKPIPLTSDNLNSYVFQAEESDVDLELGITAHQIMPYHSAIGLVSLTHQGYTRGASFIQKAEFDLSQLGKYMVKDKINIMLGSAGMCSTFINEKAVQNKDLSHLKLIVYGGSSLSPNAEKKVNEFLKEHNCDTVLTKGYGLSEIAGGTTSSCKDHNPLGGMGIPFSRTNVAILDRESKEPLKFNDHEEEITGELAISSDAVTPGYLDDRKIASKTEIDGEEYLLSGDIVSMNKEGLLRYYDRNDRRFSRSDGYKILPGVLEEALEMHPMVKEAVITPIEYKDLGIVTSATICLDQDYTADEKLLIVEDVLNKQIMRNDEINSRLVPNIVQVVKEIPKTNMDKKDYNKVKNSPLANDYILVEDLDSTLNVDHIKVSYPSKETNKVLKKSR